MATMEIKGPIEISDDMAKMLFEHMTDLGKTAVAFKFADRLTNGPLSDKTIQAAARVYMERVDIPKAGAKALRDGVADECKKLGKNSIDKDQLKAIVEEETRIATVEWVKSNIGDILADIPKNDFIAAAAPVVANAVARLADTYFLQTEDGKNKIMGIINAASDAGKKKLISQAEKRALMASNGNDSI